MVFIVSFIINACNKDVLNEQVGNKTENLMTMLNVGQNPNAIELLTDFEKVESSLPEINLRDMPILDNGRLKFRDKSHFLSFYQGLKNFYDAEMALDDQSSFYLNLEDKTVLDPYGPLLAFENHFPNYTSLRKFVTLQQSFDLLNGLEPNNSVSFKTDAVMASLFNSDIQIKIGDTIYWHLNNVMFLVNNDNEIDKIKAGRVSDFERGIRINPWDVNTGIRIMEVEEKRILDEGDDNDPCKDINATFSASGFGLNYSFIFTGSPNPNQTTATVEFFWNFGDGTTSTDRNPSHSYANPGKYTVSLYLEVYNKEEKIFCNATYSMNINVVKVHNDSDCEWFEALSASFIFNEVNEPGKVCFTPIGDLFSQIYDQDINASYLWSFGDGGGSTEKNPCHTYSCDDTYYVTLDVTTVAGCHWTLTLPVTINSYGCCDANAGAEGKEFYYIDNDSYKITWDQNLSSLYPFWLTGEYQLNVDFKHYSKWGGVWWRKKADLSIVIDGDGYQKIVCECEKPVSLDDSKKVKAWHLDYKRSWNGRVKTRRDDEWNVKYNLKNGSFNWDKLQNTDAFCGEEIF